MRPDAVRAISPLRAVVFAAGLSIALAVVVAPALPGSVQQGGQVVTNQLTRTDAAAAVLVSLLCGGALALYLYLFQPRSLGGKRRLALLAIAIVISLGASRLFLSITLPDHHRLYLPYVLPVAAAPMLIATLLDEGLGLAVAALLAVLIAFGAYDLPVVRAQLAEHPLDALQMATVFLLGGLVGVGAAVRTERALRYLMVGVAVTGTSFILLLAFWLLSPERHAADVFWMLAATALGGLLSSLIGAGATGVVGSLFGITTRVQLMALAQLSHPLLRLLQEQAPGTFHHSVIVGNLAERAADLIGADALLVRVGCYFHDIGKTARPDFYIENQRAGENPYAKLSPLESAQMVANHVRAGLALARQHRVPAAVRDFIPEHHGTRLVTYFYRKAAAEDPGVDVERFRYPGPRPQRRETAIVMMADSVEAIVRSSRDRSPERIDSLVQAVIAERLAEGQLDECDLTLRDLQTIAESFKATLRGVYHARIDYPAPAAGERQVVAAALGAPEPLGGPMDGNAPPPEPLVAKAVAKAR